MTIKEIVQKYLTENKYDGLTLPDYDCGCGINDLMPCGEINENCKVAKKVSCSECNLPADQRSDCEEVYNKYCFRAVDI